MSEKLMLEDIRNMKQDFLTPAIVGQVMGCNPHAIRVAARTHPEYLRFPTIIIGSRVKIPRIAFLNAVDVENLHS